MDVFAFDGDFGAICVCQAHWQVGVVDQFWDAVFIKLVIDDAK